MAWMGEGDKRDPWENRVFTIDIGVFRKKEQKTERQRQRERERESQGLTTCVALRRSKQASVRVFSVIDVVGVAMVCGVVDRG
jgi:hypothetical protein